MSICYEDVRRGDVYRFVYRTPKGEVPRRFVVVSAHSCYVWVAPEDRLPPSTVEALEDADLDLDLDLDVLIPDDAVEKFTGSEFSRQFEEVDR